MDRREVHMNFAIKHDVSHKTRNSFPLAQLYPQKATTRFAQARWNTNRQKSQNLQPAAQQSTDEGMVLLPDLTLDTPMGESRRKR
ncbi:hypothetical protein KIN20_003500 [Parelaphostrongylus tenuis]|uniref:Uncharacterized protein n=1 Tax=Parelaphostrongylus tenuis TaxID=148309 RepID=A0AAD5MIG8_PARTN|nr:hypothetical protein KIN20_003500 [Parelaphostrongylus tenuis]